MVFAPLMHPVYLARAQTVRFSQSFDGAESECGSEGWEGLRRAASARPPLAPSGGSVSLAAQHFCPVCGIIATSQANLEVRPSPACPWSAVGSSNMHIVKHTCGSTNKSRGNSASTGAAVMGGATDTRLPAQVLQVMVPAGMQARGPASLHQLPNLDP